MLRPVTVLGLAILSLGSFGVAADGFAQGGAPGSVSVSGAVTGLHAFDADLEGGGGASWSGVTVSGGISRQFVPAFAGGISLKYDAQDWIFRSPTAFGGEAPWRHIQRPGATLNLSLALSRSLLVGLSPLVEWAFASDASSADGLIYGSVLSAVKVFSPRFTLGGGASVTRQFYDVKTSPFVIVNWKLSERLRIANAFPAGPEGGAGVELRYAMTEAWELAAGGVSRSERFRLGPGGGYDGDVGEAHTIPLFARLSRRLSGGSRVDVYGGALARSGVRIKSGDGHDIVDRDLTTAPAVAATVAFKF